MRTDTKLTRIITIGCAITFLIWTSLLSLVSKLDTNLQISPIGRKHFLTRLAKIFSYLASPALTIVCAIVFALWAYHRRYSCLAKTVLVACLTTFFLDALIKNIVRRNRPKLTHKSSFADKLTHIGYSYPSAHAAMAACALMLIIVIAVYFRISNTKFKLVFSLGVIWWILTCIDRWYLNVHWFSDLVGGTILGFFAASISCLIFQLPLRKPSPAPPNHHNVVVIFNPTKISRNRIESHLGKLIKEHGWHCQACIATDHHDFGWSAVTKAKTYQPDLVLVAGGDGTVRIVLDALANTNIPTAIIPVGTANLLALNLGIPLDQVAGIHLGLTGITKDIDLIEVSADNSSPKPCLTMAGAGNDAKILADTKNRFKAYFGWLAYILAAFHNLKPQYISAKISLDNGQVTKVTSSLVMVTNVSRLRPWAILNATANPFNGQLNVILASAKNRKDILKLIFNTLIKHADPNKKVYSVKKLEVTFDQPQYYHIDGESMTKTQNLIFTIKPETCLVKIPKTALFLR